MIETLWIAGADYSEEHYSWDLFGVFSSKEEAMENCTDDHHFVVEIEKDQRLVKFISDIPGVTYFSSFSDKCTSIDENDAPEGYVATSPIGYNDGPYPHFCDECQGCVFHEYRGSCNSPYWLKDPVTGEQYVQCYPERRKDGQRVIFEKKKGK